MENKFFFSTNLRKTRKKSTSASFKDAYCQSDNLAETHSSMHIDNTRYSWELRPSFKGNNNMSLYGIVCTIRKFNWDSGRCHSKQLVAFCVIVSNVAVTDMHCIGTISHPRPEARGVILTL